MTSQTLTSVLPVRLAADDADYRQLGLDAHAPAAFEDAMRTDGGPGTYEWWYFDAHLDDGAKLVVVFYTKASGDPRDPLTPKVSINLDLADGRRLGRVLTLPADRFRARTDICDVTIGDNRFSGDLLNYRIHATIGDVSVDVEIARQVPSWRPGTGHWYFGTPHARHLFAWFLAVPNGHVRARYVVAGIAHETTGNGYHDHNWGDVPMAALIHDWYWARGSAGPYSIVVAFITAEARYGYAPLPILLIARDGVVLTGDGVQNVRFVASDVAVDTETGKPVANLTRYEYTEGADRYVVTFEREQTILRNRQIEILPAERRAEAQAAGFDGVYLRFTGTMTFEHYQHGVAVASLREPSMWELMYFGQPRIPDPCP